jgi:hypothetical protein
MRFLLFVLAALLLALPAGAAKGGPAASRVNVVVVVPDGYVSNTTPAQAVTAVQSWLGSPSDVACIGSQYTCTMEGWFRHELGQVFDYDLTVVSMEAVNSAVDACGSYSSPFVYFQVNGGVEAATGINFDSNRQRTMLLLMGGGGWAGHYAPTDRGNSVQHFGMVGDWGVMEQYGVRNSCMGSPDAPAHGFSHEFMGMMGAYVTAGYNEGGLFLGDVMSANIKSDLMRYSGKWLHSP